MSWTYEQSTGWLIDPGGKRLSQGYSGSGDGKNNPLMQTVQNIGPIPLGVYRIGDMILISDHGPHALPLTPDVANEMYGRSEFLIHGDSIDRPGCASKGCIIQPRYARDRIAESGDRGLVVIVGDPGEHQEIT